MTKKELNRLLALAELSKRELAELMSSPYSTVNGWGISGRKIPVWVKSWLTNYIELQSFKRQTTQEDIQEDIQETIKKPLVKQKTSNKANSIIQRLNLLEKAVFG